MKQVLVHIRPFDAVANARVDIRVADGPNGEAFGASGVPWSPALLEPPKQSFEFFSLNMDGRIQAGRSQFTVLADAISSFPRPRDLYWQGAEVKIYLDAALEAAGAVPDFFGLVTDPRLDTTTGRLAVTAEVPIIDIDKPLLTKSFTGLGGISGDVGKRGVLLPAGFGANFNIEPIWFDLVHNIGMIDGYANTVSIDWLGEGLSSLGARVANYASYAALSAAIDSGAIKPGQWGTCVAEGLVGLGAPPAGVITVHATFGANRAGAWIRRIAETHLGLLSARIDTAAMASLDTAVNRPVHYWTAEQRNAKDLIEAIARSCNATPLMSPQRLLTVTRAVSSAAVGTIDRSGLTDPRVTRWRRGEPESPFSQIKARTARPARVMRNDEVNYEDTLVDRGGFDITEIYRTGNIVGLTDGSEWLYQNPVPSAGNSPPTNAAPDINGFVQDAWWIRRRGPTISSFRVPTPPANAVEGNEWTDVSDNNTRYRHAGAGISINGVELTFNGERMNIPWQLVSVGWGAIIGTPTAIADGRVAAGLNPDGTAAPGKVVATSMNADILNKIVSAEQSNVAATDAGALLLVLAGVATKPSQSGYVHLILTCDLTLATSPALTTSILWGILQRSPASAGIWSTIKTWRMGFRQHPFYVLSYNSADPDYLVNSSLNAHSTAQSVAAQFIDVPPTDGSYDYRWLVCKTSVPGTITAPTIGAGVATTAAGVALSVKVAS